MVKTIQTLVDRELEAEFRNYLEKKYYMESFSIVSLAGSHHLGVQFYDKNEAQYFDKNNLDAKFLINKFRV
jgi:hypothetical protein